MRIKGSLVKDSCTLRHASLPSSHWTCFLPKLEMNVEASLAGAQNCVRKWLTGHWHHHQWLQPTIVRPSSYQPSAKAKLPGFGYHRSMGYPKKKNPPLILCSRPFWATRHETQSVTSSHVWGVRTISCQRKSVKNELPRKSFNAGPWVPLGVRPKVALESPRNPLGLCAPWGGTGTLLKAHVCFWEASGTP